MAADREKCICAYIYGADAAVPHTIDYMSD